jgi:hypothetical protein
VVGPNGQPVGGEGLYLVAWPPSSAVSALRPGQQVPWLVLGSAVTAASGSYSIGGLSVSLGGHEVVVGGAWSIVHGVNMKFTYMTGQNSLLGLAVSAGGAKGTWKGGGTHATDKSVKEDYPVFHNNVSHVYKTIFRYGQFEVINATCDEYQKAEETKYLGEATEATVKAVEATKCKPYQGAGAGIVLNKNSAYTYSTGVDITTIPGIDLSAETGYDTDTSVAFHVVDHGTHFLCGTNAFPGSYPKRAQWVRKDSAG